MGGLASRPDGLGLLPCHLDPSHSTCRFLRCALATAKPHMASHGARGMAKLEFETMCSEGPSGHIGMIWAWPFRLPGTALVPTRPPPLSL